MSGVAPTQRGAACRFDADCQHLTTTPRCFFAPGDPDGQCVAANRVNPTPSGTPAPGNSGNSKSDSGSNGGTNITAIVAGAVGGLVLILLAVGLWFAKRRQLGPFASNDRGTRNGRSKGKEDEETPRTIKVRSDRRKSRARSGQFAGSTLVPAQMASPLYNPDSPDSPSSTKQLPPFASPARMSMSPFPPRPQSTFDPRWSAVGFSSTPPHMAQTPSPIPNYPPTTDQQASIAMPPGSPLSEELAEKTTSPSYDTLLRRTANTPYPVYQPLPIGPDNPNGLRFYFSSFGRTYEGTLDTTTGNFRFDSQIDCDDYYARLKGVSMEKPIKSSASAHSETLSQSSSAGQTEQTMVEPEPHRVGRPQEILFQQERPISIVAEEAGFRSRRM